jgi:cell division transport system permease protein
MVTVLSRIIHYGFKNFWRNGLLSTATVAIVTLCLMVFAGLIFANAMTHSLIGFLQDKVDIAAFFKTTTPEDQILAMKTELEKMPEVKSVEYISADRALEVFKERHAGEDSITKSLEELNSNPLDPSLSIKANDPSQYPTIAKYFDSDNVAQYLDGKPTYSKNPEAIDRLAAIIGGVNRVGLIVTILLSLIAGLVVFNTIRLVIYSNRDEIAIMRAVGASNTFVRGPYLMEGVIIGASSAVISLLLILIALLLVPFFYRAQAYFDVSIPGFNMLQYFSAHFLQLLGYQVLFGIGLTVLSSFIAVRRYLRN